jgi:exopolysaccharide production protein ExoQ
MLKKLEKLYAVLMLLYLAEALIPTNQTVAEQGRNLNHANVLVQMALFPILGVLLFLHRERILAGLWRSGWLLAICTLTMVSAAWSIDPAFTLRRAVILLATTLFGVYLATCFDWEEQTGLFGWMTIVCVLGSFVLIVFFPEYGLSHDLHFGSWKGMFPHKNALGMKMAFGILLLYFTKPEEIPAWVRNATIVGAIILLIFSGSATPLVSAAFCLAVFPLLHITRVKSKGTLPLWVPLIPFAMCLAVVLVEGSALVLDTLGKDTTLTGRTPLWAAVADAIKLRPWLGYGYAVFWVGGNVDSLTVIKIAGWSAPHAHNGYLDTCLDLGFAGLGVFLAGVGVALSRALKLFQEATTREEKWPLVFLLFFLTYNVTESSIFRTHTFLWLPYTWTFVALALQRSEASETVREPAMIPEYTA